MLTLVLGGARSGKSRYAQSLCAGADAVVYVATSRPDDDEMLARIERHRADRSPTWTTCEEHIDIPRVVRTLQPADAMIIVDCITVWLSNLCWEHRELSRESLEELVIGRMNELAAAATNRNVILVSNEVGLSVVPVSPVARQFRDLQGLANQTLASLADRVVLMVAGLPLALKGMNPPQ